MVRNCIPILGHHLLHVGVPFPCACMVARPRPRRAELVLLGTDAPADSGDGLVSSLSLDGRTNTVSFCARYVRTERYTQQQAVLERLPADERRPPFARAGAWTLRGRGGVLENALQLPSNPANTNCLWTDGASEGSAPRLFALSEGGNPVELDPTTLETFAAGEAAFTSAEGTPAASFFSAHFSRDPISGEISAGSSGARPL